MKKNTLATLLSSLGAVPFVFSAIIYMFATSGSTTESWSIALYVTYGAIILSFLGGIHWGLAISSDQALDPALLATSTLVALLAWLSLLFSNHRLEISIIGLGFLFQLLVDYYLFKMAYYDPWFFSIRRVVSLVVFITLVGMFVTV